jgi:hypothetical protein
MNPFKRLSIYENETLKRYIGKKLPEEEPHGAPKRTRVSSFLESLELERG